MAVICRTLSGNLRTRSAAHRLHLLLLLLLMLLLHAVHFLDVHVVAVISRRKGRIGRTVAPLRHPLSQCMDHLHFPRKKNLNPMSFRRIILPEKKVTECGSGAIGSFSVSAGGWPVDRQAGWV